MKNRSLIPCCCTWCQVFLLPLIEEIVLISSILLVMLVDCRYTDLFQISYSDPLVYEVSFNASPLHSFVVYVQVSYFKVSRFVLFGYCWFCLFTSFCGFTSILVLFSENILDQNSRGEFMVVEIHEAIHFR